MTTQADSLNPSTHGNILRYDAPSSRWTDALPIGNGWMGAMVFGSLVQELVQLNETSFWSGGPRDWNNPQGPSVLPKVREAIFAGKYAEAERLCKQMQGPYNQSFLPLADLHLTFPTGHADATHYHRYLDLDRAITGVSYRVAGVTHSREAFASYPDRVLAFRFSASSSASVSFTARLSTQVRELSNQAAGFRITLCGKAPAHADPVYFNQNPEPIIHGEEGMTFECTLEVHSTGGEVTTHGSSLHVQGADEVLLLLTAATSFSSFDKSPARDGVDPGPIVANILLLAKNKPYGDLLARHLADHQSLFRRVNIDLGFNPEADSLTIPQRLLRFQDGHADPGLAALLYQYGRYLMIASSRPGGQPANLQGIWNDQLRPPWSSNWTININTQMNYWPVEQANLGECVFPLVDMIRDLSVNGARTARVNYDLPGWVSHHNADLWRQSAPVGNYGNGDPVWANFATSAPWLCQHLWEHYAFTQDVEFLRERAYPVMKSAAEFCLGWLIEDPVTGRMLTAPSASPELGFHAPDGSRGVVTKGTTMDIAIIHDHFTNTIDAARILNVDPDFIAAMESARSRLLPLKIGSRGNIQEWADDFIETEVHHRHVSHLYCLHPGRMVSPHTHELFAAARKTLEIRGDDGTGWSLAWKINFWARLLDGDHAFIMIKNLLRPVLGDNVIYTHGGGVYANLLDAHPPFQIDGNFGYTAGVTEMLLQSQHPAGPNGATTGDYELHLLPALPSAWPNGFVTGLKARGNITVDLTWKHGKLVEAKMLTSVSRSVRVRHAGQIRNVPLKAGKVTLYDPSRQ